MSQESFEHYVGIDVSKERLDVYCLPEGRAFHVENTTVGIRHLLKQLPTNSGVILEATGGYERLALRTLHHQGVTVCLINPTVIYHFKQSLNLRAKTDKIDARVLALFAQSRTDLRYGVYDDIQQELLDLQHCREQLKKTLQQTRNRLSQTVLVQAKRALQRVCVRLEKEVAILDKRMLVIIEQHPTYQQQFTLLLSIPGIAQTTALTLIAALPELGKLNHKALHRLVGVAPMNRDSGLMQGKRFIHGGRQTVRNALYMTALVSLRCNPMIRTYYLSKVAAGKAKKAAIVACIAKIVRIINAVIRQQTPFVMPLKTSEA